LFFLRQQFEPYVHTHAYKTWYSKYMKMWPRMFG
jgi:hypothetical protein